MFSLVSKVKRPKINFTIIYHEDLDSPHQELSNGGLGVVVTLLVCWQIDVLSDYTWGSIQLYIYICHRLILLKSNYQIWQVHFCCLVIKRFMACPRKCIPMCMHVSFRMLMEYLHRSLLSKLTLGGQYLQISSHCLCVCVRCMLIYM